MEFIKKSGSWYEYNGSKIAQGRDSAKEYLIQNPKVSEELYEKIKKAVLSGKESIPLEIAETLIRSNAIDLIAIDSVAALTPRAEIEGEMGDSFVALQARLMSQALRKITGAISKSNCTVILTNQLRMKVGVMFGNPEVTPGGNALKFYASVRMEIRKAETI